MVPAAAGPPPPAAAGPRPHRARGAGGGGAAAPLELEPLADLVRADPGPAAEDSDVVPVDSSPFVGPASARVTIIEFSDFQCGYCRRVSPTIASLLEDYGDDQLRVVFKNLPLGFHENAEPAARAALAAGEQGQFWAYHDLLFENFGSLSEDDLRGYAEELDLDMDAFSAALESDSVGDQLGRDAALARRLGFRGTPSFLINGIEIVGAVPGERFRAVIDRELEAVDELLDDGVPLGEVYRRRVEANRDEDEGA